MIRKGSIYALLFICFFVQLATLLIVIEGNNEKESQKQPVNSKAVLKFLEDGNVDDAYKLISEGFAISERNPDPSKVVHSLSQRKIRRGGFRVTSEYKIRCDLEQAEYLSHQLKTRDPEKAEWFAKTVAPIYRHVLARIPPLDEMEESSYGLYPFQPEDIQDGILDVYNKALHVPEVDEFNEDGSRIPIFSDSFDPVTIEAEWAEKGIVVIDDLLSPEALASKYCRTILFGQSIRRESLLINTILVAIVSHMAF